MSKIAVYFPGIGYHCDKPLLYYSRNIACELGYKNYRTINSTYNAGNIRGNDEKMKEAYPIYSSGPDLSFCTRQCNWFYWDSRSLERYRRDYEAL